VNPHADIDSVSADFPILRSDTISIRQMDGMIREVIQILELCSKPETIFSDEERAGNEELIGRVLDYDIILEENQDEIYKAMLRLFCKRLATPVNLEMLLRTVDTDVQTGEIRCHTFGLLVCLIGELDYVWSLKMKDGSLFATAYLVACSKALENETNEDCNNHHTNRSCSCAHFAAMYLKMAMDITKDAPATVIERVHSFNWDQILSKSIETETDPYSWFMSLHDLCKDVLKENADHSLAMEFLQKLEMCHDFFRGVLEDLVRLTRSLPSAPKEEIDRSFKLDSECAVDLLL
jgi:hypothetical protein